MNQETDSNKYRCYICEMITKISQSNDHDKLIQLEMIKDYSSGMLEYTKKELGDTNVLTEG